MASCSNRNLARLSEGVRVRLIGVDVGGTFTDIALVDTDHRQIHVAKVMSDNADPSRAVIAGVVGLCQAQNLDPAAVDRIYHGTTVATNSVLQHRGARTGMITTRGYRYILHIGRHQRPQHYSIQQEIPWQDRALVERRRRLTVSERLAPPDGRIIEPLNEDEVRAAARALAADNVDAVAICMLFSFLNPAHEERAREIVEAEMPGVFVTTSSSVSSQFREFERFTTCAINAFVGPLVRDYVERLEGDLRGAGFTAPLFIMRSNGGIATASAIRDYPVQTLLSGPAAGIIGCAWLGRQAGEADLITLDIGGTSADIGVVSNGRFEETNVRNATIAGYPVLMPMIDIHTIGTGGGSIAELDAAGGFRVGPRSAGASPGPAAYGKGGAYATVTDANIVLGRLDADSRLAGSLVLDVAAATTVMTSLGEQLGMTAEAAAEGVIAVANSDMANAIRSRTIEKGIDPRRYALLAFGGCGPLHAVEVAAQLGIERIIIPPLPGINSAIGLMTADLKSDAVRSILQPLTGLQPASLDEHWRALEAGLTTEAAASGADVEAGVLKRAADLRYVGQGYELRVDVAPGPVTAASLAALAEDFHRLHLSDFGHAFTDNPIELVNVRATLHAPTDRIEALPAPAPGDLGRALLRRRPVLFRDGGGVRHHDTAVYARADLPLGETIDGPAIILQMDSTTLVAPGYAVRVDPLGNLIIEVKG